MLMLEYTLAEKEFCDFNYYTGWKAPWKKSFRRIYYSRTLVSFGIIAAAFFFLADENKMGLPVIIGIASGFATLLFMLPRSMRSAIDKQTRQAIQESGIETILPPTTLIVTGDGILDKTPHAETRYSWSAFHRKAVANDCYYLYVNSRLAIIVPVRVFRSAAERQDFEALLSEYFPLTAELSSFQQTS